MKTELEVIQAEMLRKLVGEHKKNCNIGDCDIMLSPLLPLYERLIDRPATKEEHILFM